MELETPPKVGGIKSHPNGGNLIPLGIKFHTLENLTKQRIWELDTFEAFEDGVLKISGVGLLHQSYDCFFSAFETWFKLSSI